MWVFIVQKALCHWRRALGQWDLGSVPRSAAPGPTAHFWGGKASQTGKLWRKDIFHVQRPTSVYLSEGVRHMNVES